MGEGFKVLPGHKPGCSLAGRAHNLGTVRRAGLREEIEDGRPLVTARVT